MTVLLVLAIDPGPTQSAYVIWDGETVGERGILPTDEMVGRLRTHAEMLAVNALAIEMVASYGMPVGAEVFETCVNIGRFIEAWSGFEIRPVRRIYRKTICGHVCGSGKAKDANIRQALLDRVGPQGVKKRPGPTHGLKGDLWSALAVAVTVHDQLVEERRCLGREAS